ncbi:MAG: TIGR03619 family F420-dependent LLM class oxidoreductase [Myxococcota bacterium]
MRFWYAESMCDPSHYAPLAIAAEAAGWDGFVVPDSIGFAEVSDSRYPYTPDGSREFLRGRPFIDPFALIASLGAVTERLRFSTFVLKLPVRHPVLVAKAATSVSVLIGERLRLGVGLSPWPEDFRMCDQAWRGRGRRMDEMIEIVRGLSTGQFFGFEGDHYQLERVQLCPVPKRPIPILIGGHSEAALRRAARSGDGWMHAGHDRRDLDALLDDLARYRGEAGRGGSEFEIHVISLDAYTPEGVARLEERGVTDVIVGFRNAYEPDTLTVERKRDALARYADAVIGRSRR